MQRARALMVNVHGVSLDAVLAAQGSIDSPGDKKKLFSMLSGNVHLPPATSQD